MNRRWGLLSAFLVGATAVGWWATPEAGAGAASQPGFKPIAPAPELARVMGEYVKSLEELTKEAPKRRRGWTRITRRSWIVAEMGNLLSLHKDASGDLPKQAEKLRAAAVDLAKTAKLRKFDTVPDRIKTIKEAAQAVAKLAAGKTEVMPKADYEALAPVYELMEMNQDQFDALAELIEQNAPSADAAKNIVHNGWLLAETGNLLTLTETDKADWQKWSVQQRVMGSKVVEAVGKKDFAMVKKLVKNLDTNCLDCHDKYQ